YFMYFDLYKVTNVHCQTCRLFTSHLIVFLAPENADGFRASSQDETSITLQWNKVNNNTSFVLQFNGTDTFIRAPDGNEPVNHTVSSLTAGTKYTFTLFSVFENVRSIGVQLTTGSPTLIP
uniref:Fibronectin type-III domain-containing protein n=1 Tax=Poecilia reticulata TaxID=8081 RepID=A0A3P9PH93_POERE